MSPFKNLLGLKGHSLSYPHPHVLIFRQVINGFVYFTFYHEPFQQVINIPTVLITLFVAMLMTSISLSLSKVIAMQRAKFA